MTFFLDEIFLCTIKDRTVNGTFASFASTTRSPTALVRFSGGRASGRISLKTPKNEAEKPTCPKNSDRRADRFRIAFREATRLCFTKEEHLLLALMNVDHGYVFRQTLMKTAVMLSLHQVIPSDWCPSSR